MVIDLYETVTHEMNIFVRWDLLYKKRKACFSRQLETLLAQQGEQKRIENSTTL